MFSTIADKPSAKSFKAVQVLATVNAATDFAQQVRKEEHVKDLARTMDSDTLHQAISLLQSVAQQQKRPTIKMQEAATASFGLFA